ncbi:MAG: outer membrane lipid asymmetry maintenance protein MlaD [Magnetococcales bacterium]|nr:outer membrane lipid asymmetry maintenance protein MlaD [Magnetococcales bacterium]
MKQYRLELAVGLFVLTGLIALGWLSTKLARMELMGGNSIAIHARFSSVSGLKNGANVEIAGVQVGRVDSISLDMEDYEADVILLIDPHVSIQDDAIASVRTKGLIGDRYVKISPGASDLVLKNGDKLINTEPAINFEELISQFIHGAIQ